MSLQLKILSGFIFVIAIFTIAAGIVYHKIGDVQVNVSNIPHEFERSQQLSNIRNNFTAQSAAMRGYMYYKQDNYVEQLRQLGEENISILQTMIDTARQSSNKEKFQTLKDYQDQYSALFLDKYIPLIREGKEEEANAVAINEGLPLANNINNATDSYAKERNNNLMTIVQNINTEFTSMKRIALFSSILALLIGLLLGFFLARSISLPLRKVAAESAKIAEGDLTGKEIDIKTKDEVGQLAMAFNKMILNLRSLVIQIQEKSQVIASSSMQLSASSQNVAAGAQETASTTNQVASTVEQVTVNTQHIAEISEQATTYAREGNEGINRIGIQMEAIENATTTSGEVINALNESATKISQIVELITQIAEQTNLLSLNAAIEAARAGEQGRGFAVVAEEVRKLAVQSADAAKEIHDLITSIQQETNKAVQSMTDNIAQVKEGAAVVSDVGTTFEKIISAVQNLSGEIQSVASAAEQMSSGVQNVAATAEEQTASVEEISSTSQNLAGMAEELDSLSKQFKVA
ncbi:methyl-accepting chemotaxis protein [Desulfoscipio gibsoniae]|uniref:Methyl-accepting chemotaxis protein n=1 Tax=Desulfoscipio gibsoniae DSM 7213 TaxID=767817 RepID=R4KEK7_9FIRM|nr:methyl-accepting chemotaxis protein [Desulfoscipio gibsoniae]AGL01628.1 methyl-accepting chemotaxis protein [Desulfoscipio gibsoniae DSM 7213]